MEDLYLLLNKNKIIMDSKTKLSIIDGKYSPEEANELIAKIYVSKIDFNKLRNLSSQIRYGKDDPFALARMEILKYNLETFTSLVTEAKKNNKQLVITSEICISLVD
jgi:hypothetical protein